MANYRRQQRPRRQRRGDDQGAALLTVMMFLFVVALLAAVTSVVGVSSINNSRRDLAGAAATATSNAGIAEAMSFLRSHSVGALDCSEPVQPGGGTGWESAAGCTTPGWTDPLSPETVSGGTAGPCAAGQDCFSVWIGTLQAYQAPQGPLGAAGSIAARPALLRIHATGVSGAGPAGRSATAEVSILPSQFPIGVYGTSFTMHAHHTPITNESLFTAGSIVLKCPLTGLDPEYNLPAAVHAAGTLYYQSTSCGGGNVPATNTDGSGKCDPTMPYDQASTGGPFAPASPCYNADTSDSQFAGLSPAVTPYPQTSYFGADDLARYGYRPEGLSAADYSRLQSTAIAEGTYNVVGSALSTALQNLVNQGVTDPVVYDDNGSAPSFGDFPSQFFRAANPSGSCPAWGLTVVVQNASMHWSGTSTTPLVASVFVPGGTYEATGQAAVIGTLFAQNIIFEGQGSFQLDRCFVANPPSGVLRLTLLNYHAVDTGATGG